MEEPAKPKPWVRIWRRVVKHRKVILISFGAVALIDGGDVSWS